MSLEKHRNMRGTLFSCDFLSWHCVCSTFAKHFIDELFCAHSEIQVFDFPGKSLYGDMGMRFYVQIHGTSFYKGHQTGVSQGMTTATDVIVL